MYLLLLFTAGGFHSINVRESRDLMSVTEEFKRPRKGFLPFDVVNALLAASALIGGQ